MDVWRGRMHFSPHIMDYRMDVASFVTTPVQTPSPVLPIKRKYTCLSSVSPSYLKTSRYGTCILFHYPTTSNQYSLDKQQTRNRVCRNNKSIMEKCSWTSTRQVLVSLPSYLKRSQNHSPLASTESSNSVDVNSTESEKAVPSVSKPDSTHFSVSNNNNNNNIPQNRKVPKAVSKARARGEQIEFIEGKWVCMDCGYVYPDDASIAFEDLPDNWRCPLCGSPKRRFYKKQGNKVVARMSDDRWMIAVAIGFSVALVWFGYWAIHNL